MTRPGSAAALLAACLLAPAARAGGMNCARAVTPTEHMICRDASLRKADRQMGDLYNRLMTFGWNGVRAGLRPAQRAWIAARDHDCRDASCLGARMATRIEQFTALAARISDDNPYVSDLNAAWLKGVWHTGPVAPGSDLPQAGQTLSAAAGKLCAAENCSDFALEPGSEPGKFLVFENGKASYQLLWRGGILTAQGRACPSGKPCTDAVQTWSAGAGGEFVQRPIPP